MAAPAPEKRLRPRKTPRQPRAVETRARILDAAGAVFSARGYAGGTTNRIAAEAGMSIGSLYQYFPNKDAILVELVHRHVEEGTRRLTEALAEPDLSAMADAAALEPVVRAAVLALVQVHAADRPLHRVLFEESPRPPSVLTELHALEETTVALVAERLAAVLSPDADAELAARITIATIESLVHRLVASDVPLDPDAFVDEVTLLVHGYLLAKAATA